MYSWLQQVVERKAVIVTASRRLARVLLQTYAQQQLSAGQNSWRTPPIFYWHDWLNELIDSADSTKPWPIRIDDNSAAVLWERCLAKHSPDPLLSFASVVRQARQSWQRLQDWQVPLEEVSRSCRNPDQKQFAKAAWAYRESLRSNNWIDSSLVSSLLVDALDAGTISAPSRVMFSGFDRLSPSVMRVMEALRHHHCEVETTPPEGKAATVYARSFRDRQQELRAAGSWARQYLMEFPDASLAIINPELETDASASVRLVREGLVPGWQYAGEAARSAINVSFGRRLADFPAVAVALLILKWIHDGLTSREVSILLRSTFVVGDNLSSRSRFELELRRWPDRAWTPSSLAAVLRGRETGEHADCWLRFVDSIVALRESNRAHASPSRWAEVLDRFLADSAWPGESSRDSAGFQLLHRWRGLLAEFAATGLVTPNLSMAAAVERLRTMASEVIFQPESASGCVQMLGVLEASGMSFDAVWVCGLDATHWPPAPNPLALVSRALQEKYAMPDSTPGDSLDFAEQVLQGLVKSARTVVVSWPKLDGEMELSPSPLIAGVGDPFAGSLVDPDWHALRLQQPGIVVALPPDPAPPILTDEKVAGGAATVQMQSVDPFTAFARGRLGIRDLQRIEPGLPAVLKGSVAHQVLRALYACNPDRDTIASWDDNEIEERLESALAFPFATARRHLSAVHQKLLEFERERQRKILRAFIESEKLRPGFAIESVEEEQDFDRDGVRLGLRIDRIDRLADDTRLIIDYKTGAPKTLLNKDGDLIDLQLAVYAMAAGGRIGGLALINLDSRAISYKGTGGSVEWDSKRAADWPERLSAWFSRVETAIGDLAKGDVRINRSQPDSQARPLAILSRIAELQRDG